MPSQCELKHVEIVKFEIDKTFYDYTFLRFANKLELIQIHSIQIHVYNAGKMELICHAEVRFEDFGEKSLYW